ncbi:hypothetical protein [Metabacillus halosaccharovorans]|uniref:hypothetical protein n=1 Tax=Metabacillus halosaccharovorans TaxID=930124 RepID=UPI00203DC97A|nr:hypothetical protein [Metabacillus halosaccharovorans]MCM3439380.1 hypothetical protein [Metabacillus halosaccharovorans]
MERTITFSGFVPRFQEIHEKNNDDSNHMKTSTSYIVEMAATYLRENFHKEINYLTLENSLSYNPTYISRCMKKVFNITPLKYLQHYRLELA